MDTPINTQTNIVICYYDSFLTILQSGLFEHNESRIREYLLDVTNLIDLVCQHQRQFSSILTHSIISRINNIFTQILYTQNPLLPLFCIWG